MTALLALAALAPASLSPAPAADPTTYAYRPVVGAAATYAARFFIQGQGQRGSVSYNLTVEPLTVEPDGSAHLRLTPSNLKADGVAKDQPFETEPYEADVDPYGRFAGFDALSDQKKLLAVGFALPNAPVAERAWTDVEDPLSHGLPGMGIETTVKSKKGDRVVLLARNKAKVAGQSFTRETTFDAKSGQLVSMRMRGKGDGGISVGMDLDLKSPKR